MAYGPARGWILPCVRGDNIPWRCALVDYPTEAEVEEIRQEHEEFVQRAIDAVPRIFAEIEAGRCPFCGAAMTKRQVGRDVYAAPCGHRLYQGYA